MKEYLDTQSLDLSEAKWNSFDANFKKASSGGADFAHA